MAGMMASNAEVAPPGALALRPQVLRTLLWLRWRLLVRRLGSSTGAIIGFVALALLILPLAALASFGAAVGFRYLLSNNPSGALTLLFYLLGGLYIVWSLLPLMQFTVNEGLDVTKLVVYPLSRPEIMASLLITTLLDLPTLGLLGFFAGVAIGWTSSLQQGVAIGLVLALFYVNMVGLSQTLLAALMGLLRSRRYRELSLLLFTGLGLSCSLGSQIVTRSAAAGTASFSFFETLSKFDIGSWLQFIPPGMAGRAVAAIASNQWTAAAAWSGILLVVALPVLWAWSAILERGLSTAEEIGSGGRTRRRGAKSSSAIPQRDRSFAPGLSLFPAPALAMCQKDLIYFWRDPQYKRRLLSALYFLGLILLPVFTGTGSVSSTSSLLLVPPVFLVISLTSYMFGYEGGAATTLSLFPVRAVDILLGKNLAVLSLGIAESILLVGLQSAISGNWSGAPTIGVTLLAAMLAALGPGNLVAIFLPIRVARVALGRSQQDAGTSWVMGFLNTGAYLVTLILILPVAAALYLPQFFGHLEWRLFTIPLALLYSVGIYAGGLAIAASNYYSRLPAILKVVVQE